MAKKQSGPKLPPGVPEPFAPHEGQLEVIHAYDEYRFRLLNCGRRWGKALDIRTPILTTKGFKSLDKIKVGDKVFDETGNPVLVDYVSETYYDRECFKLTFDDKSEIIADANHDWVVETKSYRKNVARNPHTAVKKHQLTTKQMSESLLIDRSDGGHETNYSIPVTQPLQLNSKTLPIDPYFLGLWLGDGNTNSVGITTVDQEVIDYLHKYAQELGLQVSVRESKEKTPVYAITNKGVGQANGKFSLQTKLRTLGVLGSKHIPKEYLLSSEVQRESLLMGLIDSDGYYGKNGRIEYSTKLPRLAEDVAVLVASLGMKPNIIICDSTIYGRKVGKRYRVKFSANRQVGLIERKSGVCKRKSDTSRRFIKSIVNVPSVPVKCLRVQNESHLFLAGKNLIPTHNTYLAVNEMLSFALFNPGSLVVYFAPTIQQARDISWRMLKANAYHYGGIKSTNESRLELKMNCDGGGESEIWLRGTENYESARGLGIDFLVVDEIAMMRNWQSIWEEVLRATIANTGGKVLMCSTPKGYNHWHELWERGQVGGPNAISDFKSWTFPSWTNPHLKQHEIDAAKMELTETSFLQEFGAQFKRFTGLVYSGFDRDKHVFDEVNTEKFVYWIAGHDPGFHAPRAFHLTGIDSDGVWYQVDELYMPGLTNIQFREECLRILSKWGLRFEDLHLATMDSAHASDIIELGNLGLDFVPVKKVSGEAGKSWVRYKVDSFGSRINKNMFYVSKHCTKTIWEFENYSYPKNRDFANPDETPMKHNDHMMDCLGDSNAMYDHMFEELEVKPWDGKLKGTYVPPHTEESALDLAWDQDRSESDEPDYWESII